ncbi:hypothetical protein SAMN05216389_104195 [Oceanobacillus limi]|uniref:Uncharacterized protein n=1 Tax=Oceanobacillus limi TaxID=930131 RepID=A0A1I0B5M0_9BACI|nr:hypothetical protein [Oceanobacillus limi]SET02091.1 hypothetical protein SAMN05216389_104195 [Oceanobacillus limi]
MYYELEIRKSFVNAKREQLQRMSYSKKENEPTEYKQQKTNKATKKHLSIPFFRVRKAS